MTDRGADTMSEQPRPQTDAGADLEFYLRGALIGYDPAAQKRVLDGATPYILAIEREAAAHPLDVEALAEALNRLWSFRNADNSFVFPLPVQPDEQTARALAAAYKAVLETRLSQPGGSDAE